MKTFFYIPNIIGYLRIALLVIAYAVRSKSFIGFAACYFTSFVLDALDGIAARAFNQCSRFGACLDMLTDRMATLVLVIICLQIDSASLQGYILWWILIDLTSHWLQTLAAAQSNSHHKSIKNRFALLNLYYNNKKFMCTLCVGAEIFLLFHIYVSSFGDASKAVWLVYVVSFALFSLKGFIHVLQLASNALRIVEEEEKELQADGQANKAKSS